MRDHFSIKSATSKDIGGIFLEVGDQPKPRSRSKSSSAIFGFPEEQGDEVQPMSNIWASNHSPSKNISLIQVKMGPISLQQTSIKLGIVELQLNHLSRL